MKEWIKENFVEVIIMLLIIASIMYIELTGDTYTVDYCERFTLGTRMYCGKEVNNFCVEINYTGSCVAWQKYNVVKGHSLPKQNFNSIPEVVPEILQ